MRIEHIYISADDSDANKLTGEVLADVVVSFRHGAKYAASFLAYGNIQALTREHQQSGAFLAGKYFWMKNMVLIAWLDKALIKEVIGDLMEEGDFTSVFKKL